MNNINFAINNNYDIVVNEVNNIIPTDEFLEENYVELFTTTVFKGSSTNAVWDTINHYVEF